MRVVLGPELAREVRSSVSGGGDRLVLSELDNERVRFAGMNNDCCLGLKRSSLTQRARYEIVAALRESVTRIWEEHGRTLESVSREPEAGVRLLGVSCRGGSRAWRLRWEVW